MKSTSITIVTHCYAVTLPQYAQMLKWQLASLYHYTPANVRVIVDVYTSPDDRDTTAICDLLGDKMPKTVRICKHFLQRDELFRRAIGRDMSATACGTDVIWFTDADYLFGEGCLASVFEQIVPTDGLRWPKYVETHHDSINGKHHEMGDKILKDHVANVLPVPVASYFAPARKRKAIGGIQIIGGALARKIGYLRNTDWVKPIDPSNGFLSCKCDRIWRTRNAEVLNPKALNIPNVLRMRHSKDGRDYDGSGAYVGKEVWK